MNIKNTYFYILTLIIIGFYTYYNSFNYSFLNWDDDYYVLNNEDIKSFDKENIAKLFSNTYVGHYLPITMLTYATNYKISKLNPWGYHFTNFIFHLMSAIILYLISFALFNNRHIAFFISVLFMIHPMRVESVVWISERKDVLYVFFYLFSVLIYLKYIVSKKIKYYYFTLFLFILSLLSKTTAVSLPIILILIDYFKGSYKINLKNQLNKIPFIILSFIFGLLTLYLLKNEGNIYQISYNYNLFENILLLSYSFVYYIVSFFYPFNLDILHLFPSNLNGSLPIEYYLYLIAFVAIIFTIIKFRKNKLMVFSFLFYFSTIFLMLQILPSGRAIVAERYSYLPHIGLLFFIVPIIFNKIKLYLKSDNIQKYILLTGVIFLVYLNKLEARKWQNGDDLFSSHLENNPESEIVLVNRGLANYYGFNTNNKSNFNLAKRDFTRALAINQNNLEARFNLANCNINLGLIGDGLKDLLKVISVNRNYYKAYNNIGYVYAYQNETDSAIFYYIKAINLKKDYSDPYFNLALIYLNTNDFYKGCKYLNEASNLGHITAKEYLNKYCGK